MTSSSRATGDHQSAW